jgi:hypothetical protein
MGTYVRNHSRIATSTSSSSIIRNHFTAVSADQTALHLVCLSSETANQWLWACQHPNSYRDEIFQTSPQMRQGIIVLRGLCCKIMILHGIKCAKINNVTTFNFILSSPKNLNIEQPSHGHKKVPFCR